MSSVPNEVRVLAVFVAVLACGPTGQSTADEQRTETQLPPFAAEATHEGHAEPVSVDDTHAGHAMPAADEHAGHVSTGGAAAQHQGHTTGTGATAQHRDHAGAVPAAHAAHQMPMAASAAGVGEPRRSDEGHARLMELVRGLLADSAVQRRIRADTGLRRLWSDTAVRDHVLGDSHRH